jgi:hypothetical protein
MVRRSIATWRGNATADAIASKSTLVNSAAAFLKTQAEKIGDACARAATLDAIVNRDTCIAHRASLDANAKSAIVNPFSRQASSIRLTTPIFLAASPGSISCCAQRRYEMSPSSPVLRILSRKLVRKPSFVSGRPCHS